jgi:hypothetical protein
MAISVLQTVFADDGDVNGTTLSVTLTNVQAGSLIHIFGTESGDHPIVLSVSDPTNGTYSAPFNVFYYAAQDQRLWICNKYNVAATPGSLVITGTWSNTFTHFKGLCAMEIAGAKTAGALDGFANNLQASSNNTPDDLTVGPPAPNNVNAPAMVVAIFTNNDDYGISTAPGTGFTDQGEGWFFGSLFTAHAESKRITGPAKAATATNTQNGNVDPYENAMAIYDEADATPISAAFFNGSD